MHLISRKLFWHAFRVGDIHKLLPFQCATRLQAIPHGLEQVLDRELVCVFSDDLALTVPQMLDLAQMLPIARWLLKLSINQCSNNLFLRSHLCQEQACQ